MIETPDELQQIKTQLGDGACSCSTFDFVETIESLQAQLQQERDNNAELSMKIKLLERDTAEQMSMRYQRLYNEIIMDAFG